MSGTILQLDGSTVVSVSLNADEEARVRFEPGMVVKSQGIPRVDASTLWRQSGELVIPEAEMAGEPPPLPATVQDGSMETGGLRYMDMVPVPLDNVGYAELRLSFGAGVSELVIKGAGARLEMEDIPKYIKHIEET